MSTKDRVVVAMSGGVDSSLAAALLKKQGFDVIGVTMRLWMSQESEDKAAHAGKGCCSLSNVDDARRVADKLDIPFYTLNLKDFFKEKVVENFISEYRRGRTPNPCIVCNRYLKFDLLLKRAIELEAQFIATGHYARVEKDAINGRWKLKKAIDDSKDQTYTLYNMTQMQLSRTLFPLGNYRKTEVREMAAHMELSVAKKPDSQEICFIPDDDYKRFLREEMKINSSPGPIYDVAGNHIGTHHGLVNYTVGQRKGLGLAVGRPLYVVDLDTDNNSLIVGDNKDIYSRGLIAEDINYIMIEHLSEPMRVMASVRYNASAAPATLSPLPEGKVRVEFDTLQRAVTPGQSVVFYYNDDVVGGGIIQKAIKDN